MIKTSIIKEHNQSKVVKKPEPFGRASAKLSPTLRATPSLFFLENQNRPGFSFLSLGANLGDRQANIEKAIERLKELQLIVLKESSLYETEPVGYNEQPFFLNKVIKCQTFIDPHALMKEIMVIEESLGRTRIFKWGPRIIDIDIVLFDQLVMNDKDLIIPHPEFHNRNFILIPLIELDEELIHPVFKKNIKEFLNKDKGLVRKYENIS